MKGIFDPYILGPFDKKLFFEFVTRVNTRNSTIADLQVCLPVLYVYCRLKCEILIVWILLGVFTLVNILNTLSSMSIYLSRSS